MTVPDMDIEVLSLFRGVVLEIAGEVGLRDTLRGLIEATKSDNVPEDDREEVGAVINWAVSVLSSATGPLVTETFQNLNNHFSQMSQCINNQDWVNYKNHILPILVDLATIPTKRPSYSQEAAQQLTIALQDARRHIGKSEEEMRARQDEAERSFTEAATEHRRTIDRQANETSTKLTDLTTSATHKHDNVSDEMSRLLGDLQERYGFTAEQVLGGAHESAANAERKLAESHSKRSRLSMWGAVAWAGLAQLTLILGWSPEWDQWMDAIRSVPIVGSPVVILLFVAKREGRVATEHRARHERLQSLALQFKSWEPYLNTLSEGVREHLEKEITPKLFKGDDGASSASDA